MAKAALPPKRRSKPEFYVSQHALERIRQRSDAAVHLSDDDLGRVIDDALKRSIQDPACVEEITDKNGDPSMIVHLPEKYLDRILVSGQLYVLVKEDEYEPGRRAVVTALNKDMLPGPFNSMASQLSSANIQTVEKPTKKEPKEEANQPTYMIVQDSKIICVGSKEGIKKELLKIGKSAQVYKEVPVRVKVEIDE